MGDAGRSAITLSYNSLGRGGGRVQVQGLIAMPGKL